MAVLLLDAEAGKLALGIDSGAVLARLGISRFSVLRDGPTVAVVVDGWAFDPARASEAARLLGVAPAQVLVLRPVVEAAVSALSDQWPASGAHPGERPGKAVSRGPARSRTPRVTRKEA